MNQRINSIDSLRYIAVFAVILIHCFPTEGIVKFSVDQLTRFAVPYFFIVSGFFLGLKLVKDDQYNVYLRYSWHIAKLYLFWSMLYCLNPDLKQIQQMGVIASYSERTKDFFGAGFANILFNGVVYHFWFFNSLLSAVLVFMLFKLKYLKWFIAISIVFYMIGVLSDSYYQTPIGLPFEFDSRQFIFFSGFPFSLGVYIASNGLRISDRWAIGTFVLGLVLHFLEGIVLGMAINNYVFSTVLMGAGLFFLALNNRTWLNSSKLASLGQLAFGIYAIHIFIAYRLNAVLGHVEVLKPYWAFIYPILVLIFSTVVIWILKRFNFSKKIGISQFV